MSLTVTTETSDTYRATLSATFDGPGSDGALLAAWAAVQILEEATGDASATSLRAKLAAECQRRGLDTTQAKADAEAALLSHLGGGA